MWENCKALSIHALPRQLPVCIPKFGQSCEDTQNGRLLITEGFFLNIPDQLFCKLTQNGFFPHSFLDNFGKFEEPLPDFGDSWKNSLTGKVDITRLSTCTWDLTKIRLHKLGTLPRRLSKNWSASSGWYFWEVSKCLLERLPTRSRSLLLCSKFELGIYGHLNKSEIGTFGRCW